MLVRREKVYQFCGLAQWSLALRQSPAKADLPDAADMQQDERMRASVQADFQAMCARETTVT